MPSSDKGSEGDARQGRIGRGNNDDEDVGDGVVAHAGAGRYMLRWIGSSPLTTAGGRDPFSLIAFSEPACLEFIRIYCPVIECVDATTSKHETV